MSDNKCSTGTDLSETQKPASSPEDEQSTELDPKSRTGTPDQPPHQQVDILAPGSHLIESDERMPVISPEEVQALTSKPRPFWEFGDPYIGLLTKRENGKLTLIKQMNQLPSDNRGQFVYKLKIAQVHRPKNQAPKQQSYNGTAIYIGRGLFLTAAHNLGLDGPGWEPKGLYVVHENGKEKYQLEPAGFMDPEITPLNGFIPSSYELQAGMDIALLKIREGDPPDSSRAANPYIIPDDDSVWSGAPNLRFWGVNRRGFIPKPHLHLYPGTTKEQHREAFDGLQLDRVSTYGGNGSFAVMDSSGKLKNSSDSKADFITYDISTSAGASGSAITTDTLDQPKLLGIHRGFTDSNVNRAVNLNTPRFSEFFTRCTSEMVEKDPEEFSDWEWMKMRAK